MTMLGRGVVFVMLFVGVGCSNSARIEEEQPEERLQGEFDNLRLLAVDGGIGVLLSDAAMRAMIHSSKHELSESDRALLAEYSDLFEKKGATATAEPETPQAPAADATTDVPVLFGYETRDHQLWLHTGTEKPLYTVNAKDGRTLATGIDGEVLARDYPSLHELVSGAVDLIDD